MNILHLKYAVEVAATGSINKAAENLYMGQPNLSRAIKELEESLEITIFHRTPKGIHITEEGQEFLHYAGKILSQVEQMENFYNSKGKVPLNFEFCAPEDGNIAQAVASFTQNNSMDNYKQVSYINADFKTTIDKVSHFECNFGIVRFESSFEDAVKSKLENFGLKYEKLKERNCFVIMSKNHPLAGKKKLTFSELQSYIEVSSPLSNELFSNREKSERQIRISDRLAQSEILMSLPGAYMWAFSLDDVPNNSQLVEKKCADETKKYIDGIIFRNSYTLTDAEKEFIKEIK